MIRILRIFLAAFAAAFAREILPKPPGYVSPFCGKCNLDCDECSCLEAHYSKQVNLNGYSIEQLHRDIKEFENHE